ncbi:6-bladed beta-propeller [uncultured Parabacteroides sp.]|uniref:6-bladed beta-propeller n=1 Tax=uncultured Parabacteroides sp. TaxID=512312 RepID=UPI00272AC892|nr:6-bladed beta-propeller [uncultured Parabacteroides sp.]
MKKNVDFILTFILIINLISCSDKSVSDNIEVKDIVCIDINKAKEKNIEEVLEYDSYIHLETSDDVCIGIITNLLFLDDFIIVAAKIISKSAFIFDLNGQFRTQIGRVGQGPGEYSDLTHVTLSKDGNEIVIVDAMKNELLFYDKNAKHIRSEKLTYRGENMEYMEEYLVYANTSGVYEGYKSNIQNTLVVSNSNNQIKYSNFPTNIDTWFNFVTHADHLKKDGKNIYYNPNLSDTIYQIFPNKIKALYAILGDKKPKITESIKNSDYIDFANTHTFFNGEFVFIENICAFGVFPNGSLPIIYDNTTKSTYRLTKSEPSNTAIDLFKKGYIMTKYKNYIVVDIDPNTIIDYYHDNKDSCQNNKILMDLILAARKDDNPILLLYKIKQ